jgi:hypothetical protein
MPTINELRERLKQCQDAIRAKLPELAETLTLTAKAIAERRIKQEGIGETYSTNEVPAWFFHGKELNGAGVTWLKQHGVNDEGKGGEATHSKGKKRKKGQAEAPVDRLGTWGEFRAAQGLQNTHKDWSYSNKMWAGMGPLAVIIENGVYSAPLAGLNKEAQDKMNWAHAATPDFVGRALKPEDRALMGEIVVEGVLETIKQTLKP